MTSIFGLLIAFHQVRKDAFSIKSEATVLIASFYAIKMHSAATLSKCGHYILSHAEFRETQEIDLAALFIRLMAHVDIHLTKQ